ncbi:MAG: SGNH/GDSL hydrolase family protein [Leptospiraceae bacterium]|nr:SGNH/GDSL hydrolase family protein [Leptospiraceae bacterium]MCP5497997.1 SGNH/GDSL hydrolase family protein [Leptospiraceae bacterium]
MQEYIKFLKDKSLLTALLVLFLMELSMQFGCYKPFLKKNSYAANVNRIADHVISKANELDPDILILGTSLAYQGLSVPMLNKKLEPFNLKVQSIAVPGGEIIVQGLILEKVLKTFKKVKYIIHVNEAEAPWIDQRIPSDATLAMISEFNRIRAIEKIREDKYDVSYPELSFMLFKFIAYRRDIGDAILNPNRRIKDFGRMRKNVNNNPYEYENEYMESLSLYNFETIEKCLEITTPFSPIASGSNDFHRDALFKTCNLAKSSNLPLEKNELTKIYELRLGNLYNFIQSKNIKIINVFPPLPSYLEFVNYPKRIEFWEKEFSHLIGKNEVINLLHLIPKENNPDYYYDLIHLNRKGMVVFSDKLGDSLIEYFQKINVGKGDK